MLKKSLFLICLLFSCALLAAEPGLKPQGEQPGEQPGEQLGEQPGEQLEMDVTGMTCPFCVYGVEKKLKSLPGVAKVQVSLDEKKARIFMQSGHKADRAAISAAITDAGFTPGDMRVLSPDVLPPQGE